MNLSDSIKINRLTNLDAEQGLLGSLLSNNAKVWDIIDLVRADDFAAPVHGDIFKSITDLVIESKMANFVTLKQMYAENEWLKHVGGSEYLYNLVHSIGVISVKEYAGIISELATRRRLLDALDDARAKLSSGDESIGSVCSEISSIFTNLESGSNIRTKRDVARAAISAITLPPECHSTGLNCFDKVLGGGLYAGFTYGIGGAEKRGKTTLAHTISQNLNDKGILHAYIALEMGSIQIEQRNLARAAGVNSLKFLQNSVREDTAFLKRIGDLAVTMPDNTLYLDMPGGSLEQIQLELGRLVSRHSIKGFILDYWQLVEGQQKGETEERHLRRVAQWVANFARKNGIWCILLSQVNSEGTLFAGKGLVKACDQLYIIEQAETGAHDIELWLKMTHSRYTPLADVGSDIAPKLFLNKRAGPHIEEIHD